MTYEEALLAILNHPKTNGHAKAYASAGLRITGHEGRRVQCLYLLNNISHWRAGPLALEVRHTLRQIGEDRR